MKKVDYKNVMDIQLASGDEAIAACYPAMRELRPHVGEQEFLSRVRAQQAAGYRLACLSAEGTPVAVAGFRIGENLAWDRHLYVDDLVTLPDHRSMGYGSALLAWLRSYAVEHGCAQLHLDSGLQREAAHRFYEREGMTKASFHFAEIIQ
jgi:GNAT superfamily N-acetyltransferase